jgi:hypothetical protein
MTRKLFLSIVACIASTIGALALVFPAVLLASKGVPAEPGTLVWVREVGVLLASLGVMSWLLRAQPDSPTMRAFLIGNALVQLGLFPIELLAWSHGVITRFDGIAPNSVLHLVLASAFAWFALRVSEPTLVAQR